MPGIFKKLNANDIKITPFEAHKKYSTTNLSSIGASADFVYWSPYNKSTFTTESLKYYQIDKLFYRNYIQERANRLELNDATYTTQERRLYEYSNIISLPQKTFGSEIQPGTFILSCSYSSSAEEFYIADDGFGNLYDSNRGKDNFPNEDYRVLYLSPRQGFKRRDLTINPETGNPYVNSTFISGYSRTVYDDSYFLNEVEFKNVNFTPVSESGFHYVNASNEKSYIEIPHKSHLNFEKDDDFTINFYYYISNRDNFNSKNNSDNFYILSKEGVKTTPIEASKGTQFTLLKKTGSLKIGSSPIGPEFPYRIYYKGGSGTNNTSFLFFERSDGETTQTVSASFHAFNSNETQKFISCKSENGVLKLKINAGNEATSTDQNSLPLEKKCSNRANTIIYGRYNSRGILSDQISHDVGYTNSTVKSGHISQLMIWNKALSSEELTNVSESFTGTPNIGNIFYDNGFAVITHPNYKNVLNNYDIFNMNSLVTASITASDHPNIENGFRAPSDLFFAKKGTKLFISSIFAHGTGAITEYDLTTPYDISTLSGVKTVRGSSTLNPTPLPTQSAEAQAIFFNPTGTKLLTCRNNDSSDGYSEMDLSSSFDVGSAHNLQTFNLPQTSSGITFNRKGDKLITGDNQGTIRQYKLPINFSFKNAQLEETYNVKGHPNSTISCLKFDNSGYKLFAGGIGSGGRLFYLELNKPYDISSVNNIFNINLNDKNIGGGGASTHGWNVISGIEFNQDGSKIYLCIQTNAAGTKGRNQIYQLDLERIINRFEYKNTHLITENEYQCTMTEDEFEFTRNLSARKIPFNDSEDIANFVTGSNFKPYVTSVGLYDDDGNLLVVGKLGQPIKASSETDTTFVIRFDT